MRKNAKKQGVKNGQNRKIRTIWGLQKRHFFAPIFPQIFPNPGQIGPPHFDPPKVRRTRVKTGKFWVIFEVPKNVDFFGLNGSLLSIFVIFLKNRKKWGVQKKLGIT